GRLLAEHEGGAVERLGGQGDLARGVDHGAHAVAAVAQAAAVEGAGGGDLQALAVDGHDGGLAADVQLAVAHPRVVGERQPDGQHHREEGEGQQEDDRRQQVVPRHDPGEAPRDVAQDQDQRDGADGDADEGRRLGGEQAHQEVARDPHRGGEQQGQRDEAERPEDTAGGGAAAGQVVLQGTRDVDGGYPLGFGRAGGGRGRGAGLPRARGQGTVPLAAILLAVV